MSALAILSITEKVGHSFQCPDLLGQMITRRFSLLIRPGVGRYRGTYDNRSEGLETSKLWKDAFLKGRVIVPANAILEWKEMPKGQKKPKYEIACIGREPFGMAGVWSAICS
ncbi:MAG: SOS response-associated peptidase family protein [Edaphobacter sp.]